ncbi:6-phosphogluconolactonase [uncultured Eudoraea sp.]|uniref:6-phosphogluconolactonase n=1 Tax=uncultured Eudoraea sp. TaxID=1035614 RepID=UPI0026188793|nr:6-phosphogluconolactonase [uncultured Eudoraea sp.]
MKINISDSKQQTARLFSEYLVNLISNNVFLHIALSGGSTPKEVFKELAAEFEDAVDWSKVQFYWGDERCVQPENSQSNYKMANELLFSKLEIPLYHIHRIKGENEPVEEATRYARLLGKQLPVFREKPQFDLVILGLGDDGHTASIFPDQIDLWNSSAYCEVAEHPETGQKRITLTGNIINNAKEVAFLVTGANKAQKVLEVVERRGNYTAYPASLVNPDSGRLNWFLDQEASKLLTQF